ncbi:MAG TPA: BamA/TamA family outer membrane protein [Gemmatimonadales bacterium]|nr:BamA/TamA family outer membrane protein [Gemmatimonadales bacterium]
MLALLLVLATVQDTTIIIHPDSSGATLQAIELPRVVTDEVIRFYNAPSTTRLVGRTRLPRGNEWRGDVAVRNGPALIGGRVNGALVVINGDVLLEPGAEITGDLIVVGGTVDGTAEARIGGELRQYREPLLYRLRGEGDEIAYAPNLRRRALWNPGARVSWGTGDTRSTLTIATGGTFNRVEGLPIVFGPLFDWKVRDNLRVRLDALGVFRSAGDLSDKRSDLGYMLRTELRSGEVQSFGVGFRAYDVVTPIEDWGLRNAEVGWSAFVFARDYRDYYLNKGWAARAFAHPERQIALTFEVRRDWQASVAARDPWTLFRNSDAWRPNPPIDEGHYTTLSLNGTIDSRNDFDDPTSGWLVRATLEYASSKDVTPQTGVPAAVRGTIPTDGSYAFDRLFLDVRRYARVSASGRLNLRLLAGGWVGGDPLPLQRRLSLGGPDPMTGYAFRESACNRDIADPAFTGSLVAACDRVVALQAEYRGHLKLNWSYTPFGTGREEGDEEGGTLLRLEGPDLVVFGDAGQAWLVGNGPGRLPSDRLPTLGSWLAELGLGVDWGGFGLYVAKAVTTGERLRFTVRLDHRF